MVRFAVVLYISQWMSLDFIYLYIVSALKTQRGEVEDHEITVIF